MKNTRPRDQRLSTTLDRRSPTAGASPPQTSGYELEKGEITPSLKVKRNIVEKKYGDEIEALYREDKFDNQV